MTDLRSAEAEYKDSFCFPCQPMLLYILIAYFVLNLVIGLVLHLRTSIRTLERPKPMELVVYSAVMLLIGLPLFLVTRITGGSLSVPGSPDLEIVPNPRDKR